MCRNLRPTTEKSATVYKIIAKKPKGSRYYSLAMGFKYPQKGKVPRIRVQHCLGHFNKDILIPGSPGHESKMIGRTAGYTSEAAAKAELKYMSGFDGFPSKTKFSVLIVKTKLTNELMTGRYGHYPIIAGKHIEFLE